MIKKLFVSIKKIYIHVFLKIKFTNSKLKLYSYNVSQKTIFGFHNFISKNVFIGDNVKIGDYTYVNSNYTWAIIDSNVEIGKYCSIGPGVTIAYGNHNFNYISTHPFLYNYDYGFIDKNLKKEDDDLKTLIGNDVWIGANANIKRGVKIGDGAIIGMNAVVTKDVPPYSIVAGVPAKIIKFRFSEDEIRFLCQVKWWNYSNNKIRDNIKLMYDIKKFIEGDNK